jgi:poly(beta-D-mannuronate) lyase
MKNRFFMAAWVGLSGAMLALPTQAWAQPTPPAAAAHRAPREIPIDNRSAFDAAIKAAVPGDTLLLGAGEWKDAELRIRAFGTADQPITIRAAEPGKTILTGESNLRLSGRFVVVDGLVFRDFHDESHIVSFRTRDDEQAEDCRLTNVSFERPLPGENDAERGAFWVSIYGKRNRVDHCFFEGKRTMSPTLVVWVNTDNTSDDHRIDHNHFGHRPPLGKNGGETVRVGTSQVSMHNSRTIVERNLFERCDGESEIISNKSCENVYRQNVFLESRGGLVMRHGNRCLIEGNFFFGNGVEGTGGIRLIGEDHRVVNNYLEGLMGKEFESAMPINDGIVDSPLNGYFQVKRLTIAHNTFVDCLQSLSFGVGTGARGRVLPAQDVVVANNLIVSTKGPLVRLLSQPQNVRWSGNVLSGSEVGFEPPEGVAVREVEMRKNAIGLQVPVGDVARVAAPATTQPITTDLLGRPRGDRVTAGALEGEGESPIRPVTHADVGPAWRR